MKKIAAILCVALAFGAISASGAPKKQKKNKKEEPAVETTTATQDSLMQIVRGAEEGDPAAMNEVGTWYYTGTHYAQDYKKAYDWWVKAAKLRDVRAIGNLAMCYQLGNGVEADSVSAMRLYKESIKNGNELLFKQRQNNADKSMFDAMLVGECFENGIGTKTDYEKAANFYAKAADKGSIPAIQKTGLCYLNAKRGDKALPYFKKGADLSDPMSTYYAGVILMGDKGVAANPSQAVIYILRAADMEFPAAQNEAGKLYRDGKGVIKNADKAADYFEKAAINNFPDGMLNYGIVLQKGEGREKDYEQALTWMCNTYPKGLRKSFGRIVEQAQADKDPFASYVAGMRYYIIDSNVEAANKEFKKVEKADMKIGKLMQTVLLASSKNPKANPKKAAKELEKLSKDNPAAAFYLATLYEAGNGVDKNMVLANKYYEDANNRGYVNAKSYLGDMYYEGRGVEKDLKKAVKLYSEALKYHQLTANGYTRLADCYENGLGGLPQDKARAERLRKEAPKSDYIVDMLKTLNP